MGGICSAPLPDLPVASEDEIAALKERGHRPCVATPSVDFEGKNQLKTVYVALYENGTEITLLFKDEDRPNAVGDFLYDYLRRPLFGRFSDIESFFILSGTTGKVIFPGTYSAEQTWKEKTPHHNVAEVQLSEFDKKDDAGPVIWVNTWNHLLGEKNNNTEMEITYQRPQPPTDATESVDKVDFVIRKGSRGEVDERFKGLMTSVSKVMTPETEQALGKRLW